MGSGSGQRDSAMGEPTANVADGQTEPEPPNVAESRCSVQEVG
jgi:hypothetical protein